MLSAAYRREMYAAAESLPGVPVKRPSSASEERYLMSLRTTIESASAFALIGGVRWTIEQAAEINIRDELNKVRMNLGITKNNACASDESRRHEDTKGPGTLKWLTRYSAVLHGFLRVFVPL